MSKRRRSGWMQRHLSDPYVKLAEQQGWRSRATFKLAEIDRSEKLLRSGMSVVDLGAAPGGWSQVAADIVGSKGTVVAFDILSMEALPGVDVIQGDFREVRHSVEIPAVAPIWVPPSRRSAPLKLYWASENMNPAPAFTTAPS